MKWKIAHVKSSFTLGKPKSTKREALEMLARLHELGIPWEKPWGAELRQIVALHLDDIIAAVQG